MVTYTAFVHTVIVMLLLTWKIRCEKTADQVYSLLDDRLNNMAIKINAIEDDITIHVASIHQRIDSLETRLSSTANINEDIGYGDRSMKMEDEDMAFKMKKGLAAEKHFIRKMLTKYQDKINVFKNIINEQMISMNKTNVSTNEDIRKENEEIRKENEETTLAIENTVNWATEIFKVNLESKLENKTLFIINKALNELKSESDNKLQEYDKLLGQVDTKIEVVGKQLQDTMDNRIKPIETKINRSVSFYGWTRVRSWMTLTKHIKFPIDNVNLNEGNGYSQQTGKFTAPMAGVYLMHVHIETDYFWRRRFTQAKCELYLDNSVTSSIDSETPEKSVSITHVRYLYGGTTAYVECSKLSGSSRSDIFISFTAILVG